MTSDGRHVMAAPPLSTFYRDTTVIGSEYDDLIDFTSIPRDVRKVILLGGGGNDQLIGGNDLWGGAGNDRLVLLTTASRAEGGSGNDIFEIPTSTRRSGTIFGNDPNTLADYNPAEDDIHLRRTYQRDTVELGPLADEAFHVGSAATTQAHRVIYNPANGNLLFDSNGSGGDMAQHGPVFAYLPAGLTLTADEFFVV